MSDRPVAVFAGLATTHAARSYWVVLQLQLVPVSTLEVVVCAFRLVIKYPAAVDLPAV